MVSGEPLSRTVPLAERRMPASGRNDTAAPVPKAVAVGRDLHGRGGDEVIGADDVGRSREVRANHRDQRCCARKIVNHLEADADLHAVGPVPIALLGKWQNARSALVRVPAARHRDTRPQWYLHS
jgi:hypothetical protein